MDENEPNYVPDSRMSYSLIVEKDLFRPQREEWQPPPLPEEEEVDLKQSFQYPQYPGQAQVQETRKPELYGVIIIGESESYAIMQDWKRGEPKERTRKIRSSRTAFSRNDQKMTPESASNSYQGYLRFGR